MSDVDEIIVAIEHDPGRFDEYCDELRTILESGETDARRSVAQLLGDVAEVDPGIGTRHPELLELAFEDADVVVQGLAVDTVAIITKAEPAASTDFVSQIATTLAEEELPSTSQMSGIRALAVIDEKAPISISKADEPLATLLHDGVTDVRETVAEYIADSVTAAPHEFPAMLQAYTKALDDQSPTVRLRAAEAIAVATYEDAEAISDVDRVLNRLKELRSDNVLPAERVEKVIDMTKVGAGYAGE
ncbi:hypothetical protein [Halocatena pleomorpha]|uniref:HEAT repeat domain-containing protein n=1 Tax=Halocatena pleomorpha TaxID=1785090 RepID=A0A3P3R826_9EURY|nr:hypothetical protein [Halocatena pleomorpha]RRJ29188.1 hypothetical protein EIK79_13710 [Halocatena pleomorpha]